MQTMNKSIAVALAAAGIFVASAASAADIAGAGATFPYPVYAKWAEAYKAQTGVGMNYQSIGSGAGIKQITAKTVDFGASDIPLKGEQLAADGLIQFPMVMGGVVPVINIKGVEPGQLKLTGPLIADIYMGKVTKWNDAAITSINPGLTLPNQAIGPVYRSDGSGTTFIFVSYLAEVSPEFKEKIGVNSSVPWPVGIGGKGNEGVAALSSRTDGSIGYVEYAYVKQNKMNFAQLQNREGTFVRPDIKSFQAAASGADWAKAPGFGLMLTNQPGKESWPITGATFILMHKVQAKPETAQSVFKFFDWAYKKGDALAEGLDYIPMPESVVTMVEKSWTEVKSADGKQIWTNASQ
jgi:phosphate transport system substrate-binding protein